MTVPFWDDRCPPIKNRTLNCSIHGFVEGSYTGMFVKSLVCDRCIGTIRRGLSRMLADSGCYKYPIIYFGKVDLPEGCVPEGVDISAFVAKPKEIKDEA